MTTATPRDLPSSTTLSFTAKRFFHRLKRNPVAILCLCVIAVLAASAVVSPWLPIGSPQDIDPVNGYLPPSLDYPFGTDQLGRDMLGMVIHGGRVSLYVGFTAALVETLIGITLGLAAGYRGGALDGILVRISEIVMTFPNLILIMVLVGILGPGVNTLVIVFALTGWMTTFRIVRGEVQSIKEETYIDVARAFGFPTWKILIRQILPNAMSPILVAFTINVAVFILAEAGLSILGLGVPQTTPTWGNLLSAAQNVDVMRSYWWIWTAPGIVLAAFVLAIYFLGDTLRDLVDTRS